MSRKFRLGLAGAGRMGQNHMRALARSDSVEVVAVAEPNLEARSRLRDSGAQVHTDLESLLHAGGLDGVLVCVPSDQHVAAVRTVARAGLPVLCEKPCGVSVEEARQVQELVAAGSVPLQVAYWRRFVPALQELRRRIVSGELGGIYLVACYQWDGRPAGPGFRAHSGGIFVDMGVHEFDQARWLTGQEFTSVHALPSPVAEEDPAAPGDVESAQALAALSDGASVLVSLGRRYPLGDVCWAEVYGTRGAETSRFLWPPAADDAFDDALRRQAESFARFARGAPLEGAGPADAVAALEVAAQASLVFRQALA